MSNWQEYRRRAPFSFYARKSVVWVLGASLATFMLVVVLSSVAAPKEAALQKYRLRLYETHTHEHIDLVYRNDNGYLPGAIRRLDHFLRDHRTGDVHPIDPHLFDLLYDLTKSVARPGAEIQVICGYRTPKTNAFLRATTAGVASHSLHMVGEAIDIRIPGVPTARLRAAALSLHDGGVGYYPASRFVHVDVGRVRHWSLVE